MRSGDQPTSDHNLNISADYHAGSHIKSPSVCVKLIRIAVRISTAVLAVIAILNCWMIEIVNIEAGGYLPRKDFPPDGQNPKWRYSPGRYLLERAQTPSEKRQAFADMQINEPRNKLRGLIQGTGLLQYLIAPAALVMALIWRRSEKRPLACIVADLCCVSAAFCMYMMVYRGYFSSLGW
jgi:hypothetical protein